MNGSENIGTLLDHVAFSLARQSDQVLFERLGLGFSQFRIMMILQETSHIQQKEIAQQLGQTEAAISRQVKLLQSSGLVSIVRHPKDKRQHITSLTSKGERYIDEATEVLNVYHAPLFAQLSERERQTMLHALQKLHLAL